MSEEAPKKTRAKAITRAEIEEMFIRQEGTITTYSADLENGLKAAEARMDRLDENDALIQGNIEKVHEVLSKQIGEEQRLRAVAEDKVTALSKQVDITEKQFKEVTAEAQSLHARVEEQDMELRGMAQMNQKYSRQNLMFCVACGLCVGITVVVTALAVGGFF